MQEVVLSYPKLHDRIESRDNSKAERERALKCLKEIAADFSETYIKSMEKMMDAALPRLYDGINFNEGDVDLAELTKQGSVVLVPNHQSHADYLAINYQVYKKYRFPVYIAGGINLNIFPIGTMFRRSGCFFIRRSFASDITYKLTLEAYLYYLLKEKKPIEFFFEGGRSRTGKLLPPRYGLYQMLIEAHTVLADQGEPTPLIFLPVSIVHEYVPEQKSLARELSGGKKKKESTTQLFGLFKLFAYQFGSVHINLGRPIEAVKDPNEDLKKQTQNLAFKCFREVGRHMMVTPTSLLALVLLDEPQGALLWSDIIAKAKAVIHHCKKFDIPVTASLDCDNFEAALGRAMDILVGNKKIELIGRNDGTNHLFYSIKDESRTEILYFKNTILHHFLVPWVITGAWINMFNGRINTVEDLKAFFLAQRAQLKQEFYLPTVHEFLVRALRIISAAIGREVKSLEDCLELSHKELYSIASSLGVFSRVCSTINEAYYGAMMAMKELQTKNPQGFKYDNYSRRMKEGLDELCALGRVVKYKESFSVPIAKSAMTYFQQMGVIENVEGLYTIVEPDKFDLLLKKYEKDLIDKLTLNIRVVES
ncbi:MAG: hypothetical protein CME71_03800 [Halobacteriovorax sp.]|nr:hypothetical protein [Halobacteriovorax sp.]